MLKSMLGRGWGVRSGGGIILFGELQVRSQAVNELVLLVSFGAICEPHSVRFCFRSAGRGVGIVFDIVA